MQAGIAANQALASGFTNIAGTAVSAYQEDMFPKPKDDEDEDKP